MVRGRPGARGAPLDRRRSLVGRAGPDLLGEARARGRARVARRDPRGAQVYHFLGGVRHTLWDRNPEKMLNNKDAERSSYLLIGSSAAAAVGLAAASFK